jgi:hypothetical protein
MLFLVFHLVWIVLELRKIRELRGVTEHDNTLILGENMRRIIEGS